MRRIQRLWSRLAGFCEGAGSSYGEVTTRICSTFEWKQRLLRTTVPAWVGELLSLDVRLIRGERQV